MKYTTKKTAAAVLVLMWMLGACAAPGKPQEADPALEAAETTKADTDTSQPQAEEVPPVTVDALFTRMRAHEKAEVYTNVEAKVSMVDDNASVKIPVSIDLGAEMNMRGSVKNMHIEGKAGVRALILNYDYPFETYAVTTNEGLTLYLYQNETDSFIKFENIADTGSFSEGGSFLSVNGNMFDDPVLTEEADAYVVRAQIRAEQVSTLLFNPGLIDISALESLGFSLKDLRFDVDLYFDKQSQELNTMRMTCPMEAAVNGFTMESFVVETKYLAFDDAVEEVTLPADVYESAVAVQ